MRKTLIGLAVLLAVPAVAPQPARAQSSRILKYMERDPQCKKYINFNRRGNSFRMVWRPGVAAKWARKCHTSWSYAVCKPGWDAFQGRPMPGVADFIKAAVAVAKWRDNGKEWAYKLQYFKNIGGNAMLGLVLYKVPNAAQLAVASFNSPKKIKELASDHSKAYRVLWYLHATKFTDIMIRMMNFRNSYAYHQRWGLHVLPAWKLTAAQKKSLENLCVTKIFPGTDGQDKKTVPDCLRFLGRIKSRNSDARDFAMNYLSNNSVHKEAARALGLMGHRGAKRKLQRMLKQNYRKSYKYVKRGRRSRRVNIDTWSGYQATTSVAVALVGMGDRTAKKAIKYWTGYDRKKKRLDSTGGWESLSYDLSFATKKAYKTIRRSFLKTYKRLLKDSGTKRGLQRYALAATIGLAQAGDKAAVKPLLGYLRNANQRDLVFLLRRIGGDVERYDDQDRMGSGYIRVGKGGLKVSLAKKIAKEIRRRFKFWSDRGTKRYAILATLDIEARIKAAR